MSKQHDSKPVDTAVFTDVVDEALSAFLEHEMYVVDMIKRARAIIHKREVGTARKELKQAEREARIKCESSKPFHCESISPCGTGDCKFAQKDLVWLQIKTPKNAEKTRERPQESTHGTYSLEAAVLPLYKARKNE